MLLSDGITKSLIPYCIFIETDFTISVFYVKVSLRPGKTPGVLQIVTIIKEMHYGI